MATKIDVPVAGFVEPGFEKVREAFLQNFADYGEIGGAVCIVKDGRAVVDLWGGWADAAHTREWASDTIVNVWSATKGVAAVAAHILADQGLLDTEAPVATYWPEFAQAGKGTMPVRYLLTHQAGLPGLFQDLPDGAAMDWDTMIHALEIEPPAWEPGTQMGYHAATYGWLVGEVVHRISGLSIGEFIQQHISKPLGIDFFVGVPVDQHPRIAEFNYTPPSTGPVPMGHPAMQDPNSIFYRMAVLSIPPLNGEVNDAAWRSAMMPGMNGHGNARALATIYGALANGGSLGGVRLVGPETVAAFSKPSIEVPEDFIMKNGLKVRRSLGFMLPVPEDGDPQGPQAFGHNGAGGQRAWADPEAKLGFGYTTNRYWGDPTDPMRPDPRGYGVYRAMNECLAAMS